LRGDVRDIVVLTVVRCCRDTCVMAIREPVSGSLKKSFYLKKPPPG
jgi:hypothetical protein